MGLCVVGPVGLIGPLSGGLVGLVVQWIWWAVGLVVGPRVWWACGSGGFCGVLTAKIPTLRGPTCQGLLGLVLIAVLIFWLYTCKQTINTVLFSTVLKAIS